MPTERFLNLPQEKQQRIRDATLAEFARVPFEEVSINKIIQAAGIPRGSFYQYFTDKNDLLHYVMRDYSDMITRKVKEQMRATGGNVFEVFSHMLRCTAEFGLQKDRYDLCRNVFAHLRLCSEGAFELVHVSMADMLAEFLPYADTSHFRYTSMKDLEDILDMLVSLLRRALARVFTERAAWPRVQRRFDNQLRMLQEGLVVAPKEKS